MGCEMSAILFMPQCSKGPNFILNCGPTFIKYANALNIAQVHMYNAYAHMII